MTTIARSETVETTGSSGGDAVDAFSVSTRRAEGDPGAISASDINQGYGKDPTVVLLGREAHKTSRGDGCPRQYKARPEVKGNGWRMNLLNAAQD